MKRPRSRAAPCRRRPDCSARSTHPRVIHEAATSMGRSGRSIEYSLFGEAPGRRSRFGLRTTDVGIRRPHPHAEPMRPEVGGKGSHADRDHLRRGRPASIPSPERQRTALPSATDAKWTHRVRHERSHQKRIDGCEQRKTESPLSDSNRRPLPYHGSALPAELRGRGRQGTASGPAGTTAIRHRRIAGARASCPRSGRRSASRSRPRTRARDGGRTRARRCRARSSSLPGPALTWVPIGSWYSGPAWP